MGLLGGEDEGGSTGFEFTRREVLKTGGAVTGLAGSGDVFGEIAMQSRGSSEDAEQLAVDGLELRDAEFVRSESGYRRFLRVTVQNTLSVPIGFVTLSVQLFDSNLRFLEVQNGTISALSPGEVFEGHISYVSDDVAAYTVRADRSSRSDGRGKLSNVSVTESCLAGDEVKLTVQNGNDTDISRLSATVAFLNASGAALERTSVTMTDIQANESVTTVVESGGDRETRSASIEDYEVSLNKYDGDVLAVR